MNKQKQDEMRLHQWNTVHVREMIFLLKFPKTIVCSFSILIKHFCLFCLSFCGTDYLILTYVFLSIIFKFVLKWKVLHRRKDLCSVKLTEKLWLPYHFKTYHTMLRLLGVVTSPFSVRMNIDHDIVNEQLSLCDWLIQREDHFGVVVKLVHSGSFVNSNGINV